MITKKDKIIAIFIAYNAEKTLADFWANFPKKYFDECILVDDASKDKTFEIAKKLGGLTAYQNPINLGYGGNLKRALSLALDHGANIIVDIHPDNEYKPFAFPGAIRKIQEEGYEFILGNRFADTDKLLKGGIYRWKILPILILNYLDKIFLGLKISDSHQGFRVYTKGLLENVNLVKNSNNYLFSFELIAQAAFAKAKIGEVPVETNYTGVKRGASLKNSIRYSLDTFKVVFLYLLAKAGFDIELFKK
jgi:glycosyltransferase involved in cell wall biosynthesis